MKYCKLTKLSSTHNNMRTDVVVGEGSELEVGLSFYMEAEALNPTAGTRRYITTTPVTSVTKLDDNTYEFKTANSHYRLEYLHDN